MSQDSNGLVCKPTYGKMRISFGRDDDDSSGGEFPMDGEEDFEDKNTDDKIFRVLSYTAPVELLHGMQGHTTRPRWREGFRIS